MTSHDKKALKIARASRQYVYSEEGHEYLDCLNSSAHVGHAHPHVVSAGQSQMAKLTTAQGYVSEKTVDFVKLLSSVMPRDLDVVYLCNSEAEANDLAIRIVRKVTGNFDLVTISDAFHGNLAATLDVSPSLHGSSITCKSRDYVHVLDLPTHDESGNSSVAERNAAAAEKIITEAASRSGGIAGLICDTMMVSSGIRLTSKTYFDRVFTCIRQNGGYCIVDETKSGLGRRGSHMWSFQQAGIVPDLVTVGTALGNGHPIGAVICSKHIAQAMDGYYSTFGGNPVACSMASAVVRVLHNEKLLSSAHNLGLVLQSSFSQIKEQFHDNIKQVRGEGLIWALDVVKDGHPDPFLTGKIVDMLKVEHRLLLGRTGQSTLLFSPPMCFTLDNARRFCTSLEKVLRFIRNEDVLEPESKRQKVQ